MDLTRTETDSRLTKWKVLLTVLLAFHLLGVMCAPNPTNYLLYAFRPLLEPYLNFFEFTPNFGYFSPFPAPAMYIEYDLLDKTGGQIRTGLWPDPKAPYFLQDRTNRRTVMVNYVFYDDARATRILAPYFCRETPSAYSVRLWSVGYPVPGWQDVRDGKRRLGDEVNRDRKALGFEFCASEDRE